MLEFYNKFIMSHPTHNKKGSKSHHPGDPEIQHLDLIEGQVVKRLVNPEESSYCNCNICMVNYELKQRGKAFLRQTSSNLKIQSSKMQQFLHLICAVNSKTYMKLDIPEICFFFKGEPRKLFKSNNSGVHQVQLTPAVRKNLIAVFLQNKRVNYRNKNKQSTFSFMTGERDSHIKNFGTVIPSFKHGELVETKKPQTYIFHNNPNYTEDPNFSFGRSQSEEICIMKSRDKGFQLVNQKQLRQTLKSLLHLQSVDFIQTYIKPNDKEDQIYQANYEKLKGPQNALMFNRSLIQVKTEINLLNKFSKDYVPVEHLENYETILRDIPNEYCLYQTYKMVHYMELTKDVTIEKLGTFWLKNEAQQICFFGLVNFDWHQNQKFSVDVGEIQELKQIMSSQLTDFQHELLSAWEHMKNRKIKVTQKSETDPEKQLQFQTIKKESLTRLAKEKEQNAIKRARKKSTADKSFEIKSMENSHT